MLDNYFPHGVSAALDEKILKLRVKFSNAEGYGMWWMLLEHMARNGGLIDDTTMAELSFSYGISQDKWKEFLTYCTEIQLLKKSKNGLFSHRLNEHLQFRKERSESGKKGAEVRWKAPKEPMAEALAEPIAERMQRKKERKESNKESKEPFKNRLSDDDTEKQFYALAVEYSDQHYADKTIKQLHDLRSERREKVFTKMRVMINCAKSPATHGLAKKIFHEINGFINDFGAMEKVLDDKTIAERRKFNAEESGEAYVHSELDGSPEIF